MKRIRLVLLLALALRLSATTITVNGTGDTIAVDGACTLREAVTAANTNAASGDCPAGTPNLDQIHFAVASGPQFINLLTPLPDIIDAVTIDATTQPGFAGTPLIRVNAGYVANAAVFTVPHTGRASTFRGLIITPNIFAAGIELRSSLNVVAGNYFGMSDGSTPVPVNHTSVWIVGTDASPAFSNMIGGATAADRNVFGGIGGFGVAVTTPGRRNRHLHNWIVGNYFGWNAAKTASVSSLFEGISLYAAPNTIITGNFIVGSSVNGITVSSSEGTAVISNEIGSFVAGGSNGTGITIYGDNHTIGASERGNVIVNNVNAGVFVSSGTGNRISTNSMSFNGSGGSFLGIDLLFPYGSTPNDACDTDTGPNLLQNKPVVTSARHHAAMVTIHGMLDSAPSSAYTIEVYGNPPAAYDQGHQYLGSINVTTDAGCQAMFSGMFAFVPPFGGATITATAIDAANNTSEMSAPAFIIEALAAPSVTKTFDPSAVLIGTQTTLTITLTNANATAITGVAFSDDYPTGLQNAGVPNIANTCGGTVIALPGGSGFSLSGGTIPANGSCSVSVSVVAFAQGTYVNDVPAGAVTSDNAEPSDAAASATLTVGAATSDVPLSPAALIMLAFMLAATGVMAMSKR